jgi:YggT family protein
MFMIGNFITAIATVINLALQFYIFIVFGRVIISWVSADPNNPIVRFLKKATDPVLNRIQRYIPPMGGLDLSPIALLLAIYFLQIFLVQTLMRIGQNLQ